MKIVKTPEHYIETLVKTASLGGNYLLNVGPDHTGDFHPMARNYLEKIGEWVNANGECVRGASASPFPEKPTWGYVTRRPDKLYLIVKDWTPKIEVPALPQSPKQASRLLDPERKSLPWRIENGKWVIDHPQPKPTEPFTVVVIDLSSPAKSGGN